MRRNRLVILTAALIIGSVAGFMTLSGPSAPQSERIIERVTIDTVDVLVAQSTLAPGETITLDKVEWRQWPIAAASGLITRNERPSAPSEVAGSFVRMAVSAGDPIRTDKLLTKESRFMSVLLGPGKRAVAIPLDQAGSTTAGGFVLPNDYVDVIRIDNANQRNASSQTILRNIRVLAIGPNVGEKAGEKVILGQTATLELDPAQAEFLISAMQGASLVLALRSMSDGGVRQSESLSNQTVPVRSIIRAGTATSQ